MNIGLIDVDGHNFPNVALMKIASWFRNHGHNVEWANTITHYSVIFASKIFTFTKDFEREQYHADQFILGGTGYDIKSLLPQDIETHTGLAYDLYPQYQFSVQFYSRGCIRSCPFCLVSQKEGTIRSVNPMQWNKDGKWIEVLDNNFFAAPKWHEAIEDLRKQNKPIKFHGIDIRIMDQEQAKAINSLKLKGAIHIAWDLPSIDLTDRLNLITKHIKPYKITCYVLVGFNSTKEQDLWRIRTLKKIGILPFVQPFRDYDNFRVPTQYEKDLSRWANRAWLFKTMDFVDYEPRKGFKCSEYFK